MDLVRPLDDKGYPGAIGIYGAYDGGDAAAILGNLFALCDDGQLDFWLQKMAFQMEGEAPRRHWDKSKWYGQEDRFSRDQLIPMICAGIRCRTRISDRTFSLHKRRHFLTAWNARGCGAIDMPAKFPDPTGPEVWALWLRYKKPWWARAVLWALDFETLANAILWRFKSRKNQVTRNHMLVCLTAEKHMPTWTIRLACWLNDWTDLVERWGRHCETCKEFATYSYFLKAIAER